MKDKLLGIILPFFFWLSLWQILSVIFNNNFLVPSIDSTLKALWALLGTEGFYRSVLLSGLRVASGLITGCVLGVSLAILGHGISFIHTLISPIVSIIRSTPVASFVVILWVLLSGNMLSIFIAFLMVFPIIWQSTFDAMNSIDKNLLEVAHVFEFSGSKKLKLVYLPVIKSFLVPSIVTSMGLAWKAEIAAEIIAYTKNSIGQSINDAKYNMDTPTVFAWTVVIVIFSLILEKTAKRILGRLK